MLTEFPCVEATRCLVTETEMGMRLTVKPAPRKSEASHVTAFTEEKSLKEEWNIHFDVARIGKKNGGTLRRCLQLRHSKTSQYLRTDDKGRITCTSSPSDSTWWFLQRVLPNNSTAPEQDGLSDISKAESLSTDEQYILISRKYPLRRLCCTKAIEGSGEDLMLIASKNTATEPSIWTLKFTSGELCSVVNPVVHHHMRCNQYGNISLTSQSSAWEIFRFIEAGNGELYISSWIHFAKFLTSDSDGKVYTTDMESKSPGHSERWRLEAPPMGNGLYLRNVATRRYLSVGRDQSEHLWTTTKPNDYALWHLDAPQLHTYYLTSLIASTESPDETDIDPNQFYFRDGAEDVHISSNKEGPFLSPKRESEEEWKVEVTPEGYFTFFSVAHEKYLGCNSKGDVHTTTSKGAWTLWEKKASPQGGVTFKSKEHERFLAVTKKNHTLETTPGDEKTDLHHSWRVDPCIPRTVTGSSGGYISGAIGLNVSENMPFAVFGAMEAARSSKISRDGTSQRPISSWKFWIKSDSRSSPSSVILHSPSSVLSTTSNSPRSANDEKKSNGTSPHKSPKTNVEKESTEETSSELPETSDEADVDEESGDVISVEASEEEKVADEVSDEPPETNEQEKVTDVIYDEPLGASEEKKVAEVASDEPPETSEQEKVTDVIYDEPLGASEEKKVAEVVSDEPPETNEQEKVTDVISDEPPEANEEKKAADVTSDEPPEFNEEKKVADVNSDKAPEAKDENEG